MTLHLRSFASLARPVVALAIAVAFLVPAPAAAAVRYAIYKAVCGGAITATEGFHDSKGTVKCVVHFAPLPTWTPSGTVEVAADVWTPGTSPFKPGGPYRGPWTLPEKTISLSLAAYPGETVSFGSQVTIVSLYDGKTYPTSLGGTFLFDPPPLPPDTTPPVVKVFDIEVPAESGAGAVVNYWVSAFDDRDGQITASCLPQSGALFPIGVTTVACTATDSAGNVGSASFVVTVLGAAGQAGQTIELITSPSTTLPAGTQSSLISTLTAAQNSFSSGSTTAGCGQLTSFTNKVNAQSGKSIDTALAEQLNQAVQTMKATAGC